VGDLIQPVDEDEVTVRVQATEIEVLAPDISGKGVNGFHGKRRPSATEASLAEHHNEVGGLFFFDVTKCLPKMFIGVNVLWSNRVTSRISDNSFIHTFPPTTIRYNKTMPHFCGIVKFGSPEWIILEPVLKK